MKKFVIISISMLILSGVNSISALANDESFKYSASIISDDLIR